MWWLIALNALLSLVPPQDEDEKTELQASFELPPCSREHWLFLCILQLPLPAIPASPKWIMAGVIGKVPQAEGGGGTGNRINLLPWLLSLDRPRTGTITVPQDSTKPQMETSSYSPHPKCSCRWKVANKGFEKLEWGRALPPSTNTANWWTT